MRDFGGDGGDFWARGGGGRESRRVGIDILAQTVSSVSNAACKQTTRRPAMYFNKDFKKSAGFLKDCKPTVFVTPYGKATYLINKTYAMQCAGNIYICRTIPEVICTVCTPRCLPTYCTKQTQVLLGRGFVASPLHTVAGIDLRKMGLFLGCEGLCSSWMCLCRCVYIRVLVGGGWVGMIWVGLGWRAGDLCRLGCSGVVRKGGGGV